MRVRRRGSGLGDALTFGGRVPAGVGFFLAAMVVLSIWNWIERGIAGWLAFVPAYVVAGQVWRLVTWPLVQGQLFDLLFVAYMIWWLGRDLSYEWGERTFLWRLLGIAVLSGAIATGVAFVWPAADAPYTGAWPIAVGFLFAWGLMHPGAEIRWFGILPMTGKLIAQLTVAGTVLLGVSRGGIAGIGGVVPHLAAIAVAWVQLQTGGGARRTWLRTKHRFATWQRERRARHLTVVDRDGGRKGGGDGPRWMN